MVDKSENTRFVLSTCDCKKNDGRPFSTQFTDDHFIEMRAQAFLLAHDELDVVNLVIQDVEACQNITLECVEFCMVIKS